MIREIYYLTKKIIHSQCVVKLFIVSVSMWSSSIPKLLENVLKLFSPK